MYLGSKPELVRQYSAAQLALVKVPPQPGKVGVHMASAYHTREQHQPSKGSSLFCLLMQDAGMCRRQRTLHP
jgi:hypothetical protein